MRRQSNKKPYELRTQPKKMKYESWTLNSLSAYYQLRTLINFCTMSTIDIVVYLFIAVKVVSSKWPAKILFEIRLKTTQLVTVQHLLSLVPYYYTY